MYDPFIYDYFWYPRIPAINEKPPTLYAMLNSIVNFGTVNQTKIKDLAKASRSTVFDFDYPLSENIKKEDFECMILNKFLMRRIGFETFTAFQIQLDVRLNEIMPMYNKMFDLIYNEYLLQGDVETKEGSQNRRTSNTNTAENRMQNTSENETISDLRNSKLPQNKLSNVRDGSYVTDYNYNKTNSEDTSNSQGNSTSVGNGTDDNTYQEKRERFNKFETYEKFNKDIKHVYSLIFKDLDELFYQLV